MGKIMPVQKQTRAVREPGLRLSSLLRLQWSCWSWCQVLQRSCYCYPWRYHPCKALHRPRQERFLGKQDWSPTHSTLQGYWKVRFHLGEADPCPTWYWYRVCSCPQEVASNGWY